VVYYRSCLTRMMAEPGGAGDLGAAVVESLAACGWEAVSVAGGRGGCCGQVFTSKGFTAAARESARLTVDLLWRASDGGALPVLCDVSPCSAQLQAYDKLLTGQALERWRALEIFDYATFVARKILPTRSSWPRLPRTVVLHPTCSTVRAGLVPELVTVAEAFAEHVTVPTTVGCCGFAGDKGFSVPELTRAATADEGAEVRRLCEEARAGGANVEAYSTCQTCGIGMERATGIAYRSIAHLCRDALGAGRECGGDAFRQRP
jgi:D-lactate dehydrogenase